MLTGEAKKQYQKDYMKGKRSNTGLTESDGSNKENGENVRPLANEDVRPLFWYTDGKREILDSVPTGCKVLSDGQVWRPGNKGYHG